MWTVLKKIWAKIDKIGVFIKRYFALDIKQTANSTSVFTGNFFTTTKLFQINFHPQKFESQTLNHAKCALWTYLYGDVKTTTTTDKKLVPEGTPQTIARHASIYRRDIKRLTLFIYLYTLYCPSTRQGAFETIIGSLTFSGCRFCVCTTIKENWQWWFFFLFACSPTSSS